LKEGKDEKIVLNALRVKLVARMFAVIKNNQRYLPVFRKEESFTTLKEIL
jgi:hypothetical protein